MSTLRKLRRMMVTQNPFSQLQKPRVKIADLPEDAQRLVRCLIRDSVVQGDIVQKAGGTIEMAIQATEELIEMGALKIIMKDPEKTLARDGGLQYEIVPTGKY